MIFDEKVSEMRDTLSCNFIRSLTSEKYRHNIMVKNCCGTVVNDIQQEKKEQVLHVGAPA